MSWGYQKSLGQEEGGGDGCKGTVTVLGSSACEKVVDVRRACIVEGA